VGYMYLAQEMCPGSNETRGSIRNGQSVDQLRDYKLLSNTEICFQ
jgi:hypothetical protein